MLAVPVLAPPAQPNIPAEQGDKAGDATASHPQHTLNQERQQGHTNTARSQVHKPGKSRREDC